MPNMEALRLLVQTSYGNCLSRVDRQINGRIDRVKNIEHLSSGGPLKVVALLLIYVSKYKYFLTCIRGFSQNR